MSKECSPTRLRFAYSLTEAHVLKAQGLFKYYGSVPAVQDVTFTLAPGQVLGYLGPNGSGKSTTVKMLSGLLEPTHGEVTHHGQNIQENLAAFRKRLGYVPEEANLYSYLTGEEYLDMVGTLRGISDAQRQVKIAALLELFSLKPHRHVNIGSYSKGMRQRILLIAALMAYLFGFFIFTDYLPAMERWALFNPWQTLWFAPLLGLIWAVVIQYRKQMLEMDKQLIFEEPAHSIF